MNMNVRSSHVQIKSRNVSFRLRGLLLFRGLKGVVMRVAQFHTVRGTARDVKMNETRSLFTGHSEEGGRYSHTTTEMSIHLCKCFERDTLSVSVYLGGCPSQLFCFKSLSVVTYLSSNVFTGRCCIFLLS